jgi:hypothetical protein
MADQVPAMLHSPIGACLLDRLEHDARGQGDRLWRPFEALPNSDPGAVMTAARLVADRHPTALLRLALSAGDMVGPWNHAGPRNATVALKLASNREPIAEALVARAAPAWGAPVADQHWWWTDRLPDDRGSIGTNLEPFPAWATRPLSSLLTTSPVDLTLTDALTTAWEMVHGPITVWQLRAEPTARVYELHGPGDWSRLVSAYPSDTTEQYGGQASWELRDITAADEDVTALLSVPGQHAARRRWRRILTPDWVAVAADWDAVHLSWMGFVSTEGTVVDLDDGDVTMLRGWGTERTAWLHPVLGGPEPLPPPPGDGTVDFAGDPEAQQGRSTAAELGWLRRFLLADGPTRTPRQA